MTRCVLELDRTSPNAPKSHTPSVISPKPTMRVRGHKKKIVRKASGIAAAKTRGTAVQTRPAPARCGVRRAGGGVTRCEGAGRGWVGIGLTDYDYGPSFDPVFAILLYALLRDLHRVGGDGSELLPLGWQIDVGAHRIDIHFAWNSGLEFC